MSPSPRIVARDLQFPEGPVAMNDDSIVLAEVARGTISRVWPDGRVEVVAEVGGGPNGLAVGPDGAFYVCNNGGLLFQRDGDLLRTRHGIPEDYASGSIQRVDPATGAVTTLYDRCGRHLLSSPNDIVFDRRGGFYFTDFGKVRERSRDTGSIYYAQPDGSDIVEVAHHLLNPNGIALSTDESLLYVAETETARLWTYRVLSPGVLGKEPFPSPNGASLVCGLGGYQRFDSMALDAEGHCCVATLVTGCISVISPDGALQRQVRLPDGHTTNLCFSLPDHGAPRAFVTQSHTGCLVELPWPVHGQPLSFTA